MIIKINVINNYELKIILYRNDNSCKNLKNYFYETRYILDEAIFNKSESINNYYDYGFLEYYNDQYKYGWMQSKMKKYSKKKLYVSEKLL